MKASFIFGIILMCLQFNLTGQTNHKLTAYLQTKQFSAPGIGNYVEIQIQYVGYTVKYLPVENGLIGELAVQLSISQHGSVVQSDAYRLKTPVMVDSLVDDFYDVKRFALPAGDYQVALTLLDLNSDNAPINTRFNIQIEEYQDVISISDILIAETASKGNENSPFFKSGYEIIPRIATFYPEELNTLPAYFEIYNTDEIGDSVFGIKQSIVNAETGEELEKLTRFSKHSADKVIPVFRQIDLTEIPSGTYTLNYTLLDRNMLELSVQTYEFERSNDIHETLNMNEIVIDPSFQNSITRDSLDYYLASLIPISKPAQVRTIITTLKGKNEVDKRKLFQAYWRETAGTKMYDEWMQYKLRVNAVEDEYASNFQPGFETDRGRVFLQYGAPSRKFIRENSSSEYPYEIWEYNKIGVFSNKKFIFYNPDLVNNQYRLLHSDMVGEQKNPRWSYELVKRNTVNGNVDDPDQYNTNSWGNNSREVFGQ